MVQAQIFKSRYRGIGMPSILDTVSRDAEIYFAIITSIHFWIVVFYAAARVGFFAPVPELDAC
jgi:hypothetical protein